MSETTAVVEKSLRSVFVGNIPYEATEEKLREIFSQVGPVVSFKLMHDRESGKPKGYGFCEYKDQETSLSAMRNLNAFEIGGRPLRVDNACTEKSRMEMQSLMIGPVVESPYGADVEAGQAPEAISNAVASLPPEQMFELMRQMQVCVRSNRSEARTMLLNNPQLAYALLQAQVVMRIIDPKTAVQLLHGESGATPTMATKTDAPPQTNGTDQPPPPSKGPTVPSSNGPAHPPAGLGPSAMFGGPAHKGVPPPNQGPPHHQQGPPHHGGPPHHQGPPPSHGGPPHHGPPQNMGMQGPPPGPPPAGPGAPPPHYPGGDFDLRGPPGGPPPSRGSDQDMRMPPSQPPHGPPMDYPPHHQDFDSRFGRDGRGPGDFDQRDPRYRDQPPFPRDGRDNRGGRGDRPDPRNSRDERPMDTPDRDYRGGGAPEPVRDPRARGGPPPPPSSSTQKEEFPRGVAPPTPSGPPGTAAAPPAIPPNLTTGLAGHDQEKASLIMQVLQLSDEQIRMLPPEQQASILQLKEQITQSQH